MIKHVVIVSLLCLTQIFNKANSQVALSPANANSEQAVTVTFDATGTTLAGETKLYMHAGVVTTNTTAPNGNDWKFVKGNWGKDDGIGQMTAVAGQPNKWQISLSPTLRQYFSVPSGTNIFYIALVIRNANGSKQTSPDIFIKLSLGSSVSLSEPLESEKLVTVTFDAAGTALAGESKIYMHAGVITTNTETPTGNDWKFVKGNWGKDDGIGQMTAVAGQPNKWQISLSPTLRQYFNVPSGTNIFYIALVFRNANGSKQTTPDIYVKLSLGAYITIDEPAEKEIYLAPDEFVPFYINASATASQMSIYLDNGLGYQLYSSVNDTKEVRFNYPAVAGALSIKIVATINGTNVETIANYTVKAIPVINETPVPAGLKDGINYSSDPTKATLVLLAPGKKFAYVVGDFTNWQQDEQYYMNRTPDGKRFWIELSGLTAGKEYVFQYWVNGSIKIGDPFADKVADPYNDNAIPSATYPNLPTYARTENGIATVLQTNQTAFPWALSESNWVAPNKHDLVIYEVLLRDFLGTKRYKDLTDSLGYFKRLGINAIELMPIMEFEGNSSWGYNPSYFFAPDKYYGSKNDLKDLVQKAHQQGIAVIMDMVLNHAFGQNAMVQLYFDKSTGKPTADNPWFNRDATHPFNVGYDFNHESQFTKDFVDTVCSYWMKEYHVDGFRFDLSKGFTQTNNPNNVGAWSTYDQSRINILSRMAEEIWKVKPEAYVILEHFADAPEESTLANKGMILWGNLTGTYQAALKGDNSSSLLPAYRYSHVNYMESHDEERLAFELITNGPSIGSYDLKNISIALNRIKMAAAFFYTLPGPKMLWQFGELGYDKSINYCTDGTISGNCRLSEKPLPWGAGNLNYYTNTDRQRLYKTIGAINKLVQNNAKTFKDGTISFIPSGSVRKINITSPSMDVAIVGNFGFSYSQSGNIYMKTGTWYDYFSGETITVSDLAESKLLAPGEFHIYTTVKQSLNTTGLVDVFVTDVEDEVNAFSIHPNPASSNQILIQAPTFKNQQAKISIYEISGKLTINDTITFVNGKAEYAIRNLNDGLYLMAVESGKQRFTQKVIISN